MSEWCNCLNRQLHSKKPHEPNDLGVLVTLANAYAHVNRGTDAARLYDQVENRAGSDPRVLFTLALSAADAGDYSRAAVLFDRTNSLRPGTYEVLYNLGIALYNLDRLDDARKVLAISRHRASRSTRGFLPPGVGCVSAWRKRKRPWLAATRGQAASRIS